jgi:hypothetical protein
LIDENAWSRLFAYLLDSSNSHCYGQSAFKAFVQAIPALDYLTDLLSANEYAQIVCVTEWKTHNNRRIDILIKVVDHSGKVLCVIGIENKVESGEQTDQIRDYQMALLKMFPEIPKALIYLTPDGRASKTADVNLGCHAVWASYESISRLCEALLQLDSENRSLFPSVLKIHIDKLRNQHVMNKDVQELIAALYKDPLHRKVIKLISQYTPSTRGLFEAILKDLENSDFLPYDMNNASVEYYPSQASSPSEFKLYFEELNSIVENQGFAAAYMLKCDSPNPDIDDVFTVRVALWSHNMKQMDSRSKRVHREKVSSYFSLPNSIGTNKSQYQWICLWTGGNYRLKDMGEGDAKGLTSLLLNAIEITHAKYYNGLKKLAKKKL